jgi:hypothetical protein
MIGPMPGMLISRPYPMSSAWVVLVKIKSSRWGSHGLKDWIEAPKNGCITTYWRLGRQQARAHRLERACSWTNLRDEQGSTGLINRK